MKSKKYFVSNAKQQKLIEFLILYCLIEKQDRFFFPFLDDTKYLEKFLFMLEEKGSLTRKDKEFKITQSGKEIYEQWLKTFDIYCDQYEIYSAIDLELGEFAWERKDELLEEEWSAYFHQERFDDLRIAVAEYYDTDPGEMIFLHWILSEDFLQHSKWQFDLYSGLYFSKLEELIEQSIHIDDLGYYDEESDEEISGEEVIEDIVREGSKIIGEHWN